MKIINIKKNEIGAASLQSIISGTYFLLDSSNKVVYVGKAQDVKARLTQHKNQKEFDSVIVIQTRDSYHAKMLESLYLNINLPLLNKTCPNYDDIPMWILREQIAETKQDISSEVRSHLIDLKYEIRRDLEKYVTEIKDRRYESRR
jgi:excinuclease UvrABC nuclease subunit